MGKRVIPLGQVPTKGALSVEEAIMRRSSVRQYADSPLSLEEVGHLLWAAYGVPRRGEKRRTVPSAGATYPLSVHLVARAVTGLTPGVYTYRSEEHSLVEIATGNHFPTQLSRAALGQRMVGEAPVIVVLSAVYERTTRHYGSRGVMYVHMEAGHAGQNVSLVGEGLEIGSVMVGAFDEGMVKKILGLPPNETPIYLIPCGKKRK